MANDPNIFIVCFISVADNEEDAAAADDDDVVINESTQSFQGRLPEIRSLSNCFSSFFKSRFC